MKRVLGLDLGTNSIGWAVVDVPEGDEPGSVVALGSRIFSAGAEAAGFALVTPAKERRQKRAMRRQVQRRAKRRQRILHELTGVSLLPADDDELEALLGEDPAVLLERSAAGEALTLRQVGRVVYWFSSKRGFLSLRTGGGDLTDDDDERTEQARYRRPQVHADTGEVVADGQEDRLVAFLRDQAVHHPELLTDEVIFGRRGRLTYPVRPIRRERFLAEGGSWLDEFGIHGLVFFQRSVYWDEGTIGRCSLDPEHGGVRALRADRLAQRFRVWTTIVNLRVGDPERPLAKEEREALFEALMTQKTLSFASLRSKVGLGAEEPVNFERSERESVAGNETDAEMRRVLGKDAWGELDEGVRDELVHVLLGDAPEHQLRSVLAKRFDLSDEQVERALNATFPGGRARYGRRTLRRLLEELPGCDSERDAIKAAGYPMPEEVRAQRPFDLGEVTNPLALKTLSQLGKVLAAVSGVHGRAGGAPFDVVRIELARDVRANARDRKEANQRQRANEKANKDADALLAEFAPGADPTRDLRRRARLWREQGERCLYCGEQIGAVAALGAATELDHILPRSRTLDDSLANLALVHAAENSDKGDRTVVEWVGADKADEIAERAWDNLEKAHRWGKVRRLRAEDVPDDVVPEALIVTTGYINRLARDFVRHELGIEAEVSNGRITAQLRYRLGVGKDPGDHRRHALDAAMVAISDKSTARSLAARFRQERDYGRRRDDDYGSWEPWEGLRADILDHYDGINVSHVVKGKVGGPWHEETRYGKVTSPHRDGDSLWARRRPVSDIKSASRLDEVADPAVKKALVADLARRGIDPEAKAFTFDPEDPPTMPDGQPIKKVRCHLSLPGNRVLRPDAEPKTSVTMSNNHSAYLYRNAGTGRWRIHVVPRFEAFKNRLVPDTQLRGLYAEEAEEFLFSVTPGCVVHLPGHEEAELWKVISFETDGRIKMLPINDSTDARAVRFGSSRLSGLDATKVVVLADGQLRTARD